MGGAGGRCGAEGAALGRASSCSHAGFVPGAGQLLWGRRDWEQKVPERERESAEGLPEPAERAHHPPGGRGAPLTPQGAGPGHGRPCPARPGPWGREEGEEGGVQDKSGMGCVLSQGGRDRVAWEAALGFRRGQTSCAGDMHFGELHLNHRGRPETFSQPEGKLGGVTKPKPSHPFLPGAQCSPSPPPLQA